MSGVVRIGKVGRGAALKLGSEVLGRLFTFAMAVAVARRLGTAGLGEFQYAWSIAWIVTLAGDFGISIHTTSEIARDHSSFRQRLGRALSIKLALALPLLLVLAATQPAVVLNLSVALTMFSLLDCVGHSFRGLERIGRDAAIGLCARIALFAGGCGPLLLSADLERAALFMMISQAIVLAIVLSLVRPHFTTSGWTRVIRDAFPIGLASATAMVYLKVDSLLLYHLAGSVTAGHYAAATRIYEAFMVVPAAVMAAAYPGMCAGRPQAKAAATRILTAVAIIATPILIVFAAPGMRAVFATDGGTSALRILALSLIPTFLNAVLLHQLLAEGRQRSIALINATALGINVLLNLLLIPIGGATGSAVAWLFTEVAIGAGAVSAIRIRRERTRDIEPIALPEVAQ